MSLSLFIILCTFAVGYSEGDTNSSQDDIRSILNGTRAIEGQYPYVVFIVIHSRKNGTYNGRACTGSILTKDWVLTARHTFDYFLNGNPKYEMKDLNVEIKAGVVDYTQSRNRQVRIGGRNLLMPRNKNYTINKPYINDIAIIKVTEEFKFNKYVSPVRLAKRPLPHDKERKCLVIGFGHFEKPPEPDSPLTNRFLHYTYMRLPAYEFECRRLAKLSKKNFPLKDWDGSQICIRPITWGTAHCKGDSGGPLICNNLQVGVYCCRTNEDPNVRNPLCGLEGNYHVYGFPGWHEAWFRQHIPELPAFKFLGSPTKSRSIVSVSNSASVKGGTAQTVCILLYVRMILPEYM